MSNIKLLQILNCHVDSIVSCQFARHSPFSLATTSKDKSLHVFNWENGAGFKERAWSPVAIADDIRNVYWSPHGAFLVTISSSHRATMWNAESGDIIHQFTHLKGGTLSAGAISPLSETILATAGHDGSICFWNFVTSLNKRYWQAHEDAVTCCLFTDNGRFFLTSSRSGMKVWDVSKVLNHELSVTQFREYRFADHFEVEKFDVFCRNVHKYTEYSSQGVSSTGGVMHVEAMEYYVALGGESNEVQLWSLTVSKITQKAEDSERVHFKSQLLKCLLGHESTVTCVVFNHSCTMIASVSLDKTLRLWEISSFTCKFVAEIHDQFVTDCSFSKNDTFLVTGSYDCKVKIWDATGELITLYTPFSGNDDDTIKKLKQELAKCLGVRDKKITILQRFTTSRNAVNTIHFNKEKILAIGGSDRTVSLWKYDGTVFAEIEASPLSYHSMSIQQVEFSRCGRYLATCGLEGTCVIWETTTWVILNSLNLHNGSSVNAIRVSPSSKLVAIASSDETCEVWDLSMSKCLSNMTGFEDSVTCVAFSEDSELIVCGISSGDVTVHSLGLSCQIVKTIHNAHDLGVTSCDFANFRDPSNPEYTLATCGKNDQIVLWTVSPTRYTGSIRVLRKLILCGHGGFCTCVRFSPCDKLLASTSGDKTCRLWNTITGHCLYVLDDHFSIATCCTFSDDCRFLATGSMDRTVIIYELPEHSQSNDEVRRREESLATTHDHRTRQTHYCGIPGPIVPLGNVQGLHTVPRITEGPFAVPVPDDLLCPINQSLMLDPVRCSDGFTYERSAIETWFNQHNDAAEIRSPMTNLPLTSLSLVSDTDLKSQIHRFRLQNGTRNRDEAIAQAVCSDMGESTATEESTDEAAGSDFNCHVDGIGASLGQIELNK